MALSWVELGIASDPDLAYFRGDPVDVALAFAEMVGRRPGWHRYAKCRGKPELVFLQRGEDSRPAKALCESCPVAAQCADAGLGERHGIWGGLSERQRRDLRRSPDSAA